MLQRKIERILDTITNREADGKLLFTYHGQDRIVQPYLVGQHYGTWRMFSYQVRRLQSRSERTLPGYRCFNLDEMSMPRLIERHVVWERPPQRTTERTQRCINFISDPPPLLVEGEDEDEDEDDDMFTDGDDNESDNDYVPS